MKYNDNINYAIEQFSKKKGVNISMYEGASILTLEDGRELWLEAPPESSFLVFHTSVKEKAGFDESLKFWKNSLRFNSSLEENKSCWLSYHEQTNTLRLCLSIPKKFVDIETLSESSDTIVTVSKKLEGTL